MKIHVRRFMALILSLILLISLSPALAAEDDGSAGSQVMDNYLDSQNSDFLKICEAVSEITDGDPDKGISMLIEHGLDTLMDEAMGNWAFAIKLAKDMSVGIVTNSIRYNVNNRFEEYSAKRMASLQDALNKKTPQAFKKWVENGRNEFNEYFNNIFHDGALKIEFIRAIKKERANSITWKKWFQYQMSPGSPEAKAYAKERNEAVTETEIYNKVFNDWEGYIRSQAMPSALKTIREYYLARLQNTAYTVQGELEVGLPKGYEGRSINCDLKLVCRDTKGAEKVLGNSSGSEPDRFFKISVPWSVLKNFNYKDKLQLAAEYYPPTMAGVSGTLQREVLKEVNVSELMSSKNIKEEYGYPVRTLLVGKHSVKVKEASAGLKPLSVSGVLPDGRKVALALESAVNLFSGVLNSGFLDMPEGRSSVKARILLEQNNKFYSAPAELSPDKTNEVTLQEVPGPAAPGDAGEAQQVIDSQVLLFETGVITYNEYHSRINSLYSDAGSGRIPGVDSAHFSEMWKIANRKIDDDTKTANSICEQEEQKYAARRQAFEQRLNEIVYGQGQWAGKGLTQPLYFSEYLDSMTNEQIEADMEAVKKNLEIYIKAFEAGESLLNEYKQFCREYNDYIEASNAKYGMLLSRLSYLDKRLGGGLAQINQLLQSMESNFGPNSAQHPDKVKPRVNADVQRTEKLMKFRKAQTDKIVEDLKRWAKADTKYQSHCNKQNISYNSQSKATLKADTDILNQFFVNAQYYFQMKADGSVSEIMIEKYDTSRIKALDALNRLNRYFGGRVFTQVELKKYMKDEKIVLALLDGALNQAKLSDMLAENPYKHYINATLYSDDIRDLLKKVFSKNEWTRQNPGADVYEKVLQALPKDAVATLNSQNNPADMYNGPGSANLNRIIEGMVAKVDPKCFEGTLVKGDDLTKHPKEKVLRPLLTQKLLLWDANGRFMPDRTASRGDIAQFTGTVLGIAPAYGKFVLSDVFINDINGGYIEALVGKKLISPDAKGNVYPDKSYTRGELAFWLVRLLDGYTPKYKNYKGISPSDISKVSQSSAAAVKTCLGLNLLQYKKGKEFCPGDTVTRAEAAEALFKLRQLLSKEKVKGF